MGNGMIVVNIDKAKQIAHEIRRDKRAQEFAPLDVKATIPSEAVEAESARQVIREKYAAIQQNIDASESPEQIKEAINAA
jgi:hypothetical protein